LRGPAADATYSATTTAYDLIAGSSTSSSSGATAAGASAMGSDRYAAEYDAL